MNLTLDCIIFGLQKFGGISTYWDQLINYMAAESDVALHLHLPRTIRHANSVIGPMTAKVSRSRIPTSLARYGFAGVAGRGGIFHSSYFRTPIASSAKKVITVYDFTYEKFRTGLPRLTHSAQKFAAIRRADGIICISENTRRDLLDMMPDVDAFKVISIPLAVMHERFFAPPANEIDRGLSDVVLFVGQRGGYKEFRIAVEAVRAIPQLRLGVIGPPLLPDEMQRLETSLPGRWLLLSGTSDERMRAFYGSCFAFIYPSSYEGFGLPVLEAMACGAPVVCSNCSSLPEVVGNSALKAQSQTGCAYAEKLSSLLTEGERARWITSGFAQARKFRWETTFGRTLAFYQEIG